MLEDQVKFKIEVREGIEEGYLSQALEFWSFSSSLAHLRASWSSVSASSLRVSFRFICNINRLNAMTIFRIENDDSM